MLVKLVKYDLKSMSVVFIPVWILAPVIALMLTVTMRGMIVQSEVSMIGTGVLSTIMFLLFFGVMTALTIMTILFILQRFWNGLLKEEGYLMFTLPVEPWELIVSKGLAATMITCISVLDGILACMILVFASTGVFIEELAWVWRRLLENIIEIGPIFWLYAVLMILLMIISIISSIYHAYAAMAVGQLFEGHRIIGACVSYIGISVLLSVIGSILSGILRRILPEVWRHSWWNLMGHSADAVGLTYLLLLILIEVVQIVLFFVITERILATRLNLE